MKKQLLFIMALCITMGIAMTSCKKNDSVIDQKDDDQKESSTDANGHLYVDLGLPSGLKWATCNVGAANAWDYGDYFAWGETVGYGKSDPSNEHNITYTGGNAIKTFYGWEAYKYCSGNTQNTLTKYNASSTYGSVVDNKTTMEPEDDAAHVNMGGNWRTPTANEQTELKKNCYWEWAFDYNGKGVNGYIVYKAKDESDKGVIKTSINSVTTVGSYSLTDAHIFLPAAGYHIDSEFRDDRYNGCYYSSTNYDDDSYIAYGIIITTASVGYGQYDRCKGLSIRGVME